MLRIRLTKRTGKPPLLHCVREDGSQTLAVTAPGAVHDLGHYVVEAELGFRRAFFGLLAEGWSIEDFDVPGGVQALDLPPEAALVEFIVGLLQIEIVNGEVYADFDAELRRAVTSARRPGPEPPVIGEELAARMRARLAELVGRWRATPEGGSLELEFRL